MRQKQLHENQNGLATLEVLPLLIIFVIMIGFSYGMFGVIHSGILNSIAARNYAFETFRHRTNLVYFRENRIEPDIIFDKRGNRVHRALSEYGQNNDNRFPASERPITVGVILGRDSDWLGRIEITHNELLFNTAEVFNGRNRRVAVNPVWIMVQYGICVNSQCGDTQ